MVVCTRRSCSQAMSTVTVPVGSTQASLYMSPLSWIILAA